MACDPDDSGNDGKFDELAAAFIFFAITCLLLVTIFLLSAFGR